MQATTGQATTPPRWYLAYTESRREAVAQLHLDRQGYATYLPWYSRIEPLFPRYLFFRPAHTSQSLAPVRSTRGVQSVLRFGDRYAWVPQTLIDAIREQESRSSDARQRFPRPGQLVRVQGNTPALAGLEGLVHSVGAQRIVVLMEILGRQTPVKLPADSLEVI